MCPLQQALDSSLKKKNKTPNHVVVFMEIEICYILFKVRN